MGARFDLSLPDTRMAAALVLSRRLRARVSSEISPHVDWAEVRAAGMLPTDLVLPCIQLFNGGSDGDVDTRYECGRILVAARGAMDRVRDILSRIPGRRNISEIRLDGDHVLCRLRREPIRGGCTARARFLKAHGRQFPRALSVGGADYRFSYGFAGEPDFMGIDLLAAAIEDVRSWFDSFGQVFCPVYQPGEEELQEVLVISPLGMRDDDDPWCWSLLADRLVPFLLADFSPMAAVLPELTDDVDTLLQRYRARPWALPVPPRRFRSLQRKLHWTCDDDFNDAATLLAVIPECERLMQEFASEFEPLINAHAEIMLDAMDTYCVEARERLWRRLREDDAGARGR